MRTARNVSMVSIRRFVIMILDSRRRDIDGDEGMLKTLTIGVIVRLFEQWRRDASENPRAISVERLVFERL